MEKVIYDKMRWNKPTTMNGQLDNPVSTLRVTEGKNDDIKCFYKDKNGDIIDAKEYNRVKIARAFQEQKMINQQKWDAENTCPHCGMVLSTREAQNKECDNCGGIL